MVFLGISKVGISNSKRRLRMEFKNSEIKAYREVSQSSTH